MPRLKIIFYIGFILSLFFVRDITLHAIAATAVFSLAVLFVPHRKMRSGLFPIALFLFFTFGGNVFFHSGRILYGSGSFALTDEGLRMAGIRTLRVFSMIFGAKLLTASLSFEEMINAFEIILRPLERIGVPIKEFFSVMGLTVKAFPPLIDFLKREYKVDIENNGIHGFRMRAIHMVSFLTPVFAKSIRSPESFFEAEESKK